MKLQLVKNAVTSRVARKVLLSKKHSPVIMFGAGIAGGLGTVILACNATLKLDAIITEAEEKRFKINQLEHVKYSERDRKRDNLLLSVQTANKICRLYAPAIGLGVVTVGLLTGSHVTLSRRNAGLTAAYAALDKGFNEYRARVRDEFGEEKESDVYRNLKTVEVHDTEKGKVRHSKVMGKEGLSMYSRLWDETTSNSWQRQPEYNMVFLKAQQNYLNDRLRARGHVLLNDAYDALGLERTKPGCVVGWVWDNPTKEGGDNYIDFGIFRDDNMYEVHQFMTSDDGAIWLDFNVDGLVYDLIGPGNG